MIKKLKKRFKTTSSEETKKIGLEHAQKAKKLICLYGDLGAGKTTFVKGLAKGLGIESNVKSPTFTYQAVYEGPKNKLYHFDFYRVPSPDQLLLNDFHEALSKKDGIIVVEWAQNLENFLPQERTDIYFEYVNENERIIKIGYICAD